MNSQLLDFSQYTNTQILGMLAQAELDLEKAATEEKESEWHQSCFAAVFVLIGEVAKRGIKKEQIK